MSDTITPEERARWLSEAQPKNIDYYEPIDFELDKRIRNLIGALEQAESRAEKTEAEIVRLTKMVDWLAELVFDRPCAYACCPFDKHRPTGPDDDDCDKTHIQCWVEAASRAVAEGEETCQK